MTFRYQHEINNILNTKMIQQNQKVAINFAEFLRLNLDRLKPLGEFRNWFVMNHQDVILDKKTKPLDLGLMILAAAYERAEQMLPDWLKFRLPESQLEDSLEDNKTTVKNAFEQLITTAYKNFTRIDMLEQKPTFEITTTERFTTLIGANLISWAKWNTDKSKIIISKAILGELYRLQVKERQLPNLRALADFMASEYVKDNNKVIKCTKEQLETYFDSVEGDTL
jgi:hypothetical protein